MNEPIEQEPEPEFRPGDEDEPLAFVEEESLVVSTEDLFDVPTEAVSLPGMDPVESAASLESFADSEPEPVPPSRWRTRTALVVLALLNVAVIGAVLQREPAPHDVVVETPPAEAVDPLPKPADPAPVAEVVVRAPEPPKPAPEVKKPAPEIEVNLPAPMRTGRERLDAVESALAAGRRGFAQIELGRLMLEVDSLPETEREEIRAQAELRVARLLQDAADEARGVPR